MLNKWRRHWLFCVCWLIGIIGACVINIGRMQVENANHSVEMVYDYGHVVDIAPTEGLTTDEALALFRKAGVTSFALYDEELGKLSAEGKILVQSDPPAEYFASWPADWRQTNGIYIRPTNATNAAKIFAEVEEDLRLRLPAGSVEKRLIQQVPVLRIHGVGYETLLQLKLGISRVQIDELAAKGFSVIVRPTAYAMATKENTDHFLARINSPAVHGVLFVGSTALGYPDYHLYLAEKLREMNIPFVLLEAPSQLRFEQQEGLLPMWQSIDYYGVRAYSMYKDELVKLSPEEASQRYYISDIERNIRVNHLPGYKRPLPGKTLLQSDISYIQLISEKLQDRGFALGAPGLLPPYWPATMWRLAVLLGITAITMLGVEAVTGWKRRPLCFLGAGMYILLGGMILLHFHGVLARQTAALAVAVMTPVSVMYVAMQALRKMDLHKQYGIGGLWWRSVAALIVATFFSLSGGWLLGAVLTDTRFLMEMDIFRGVKLAFVLPVLFIAITYLRIFPTWLQTPVEQMADWPIFARRFLATPVRFGTLLLGGILALAALIYVGRSGHTEGVPVSGLEIRFRRFLEHILYARPRVKEILIGHPAFLLVPLACWKRFPQWIHFILILGAGIGQASMVETFAHLRSPVWLSLMRGLDGLIVGTVFGTIALIGVYVILVYTLYRRKNNEKI